MPRGNAADEATGAPLFSIVTVCRNAAASIRTTIESVRDQSAFPGGVEHLIIDGLSTDDTLRIASEYAHLRIVSEQDAGIFDAMNKGVRRARGQYVAILNADDWYEPDTLQRVAAMLREFPASDLVHGDIRRWTRTGPVDVVKPPARTGYWTQVLMPVNHPASFARRDLFQRVGEFDTSFKVFADFEWVRRVIQSGAVLTYCPRVLANFRIGGVSTVRYAIRERYRVYRDSGIDRPSAAAGVLYACGAILRNRLGRSAGQVS